MNRTPFCECQQLAADNSRNLGKYLKMSSRKREREKAGASTQKCEKKNKQVVIQFVVRWIANGWDGKFVLRLHSFRTRMEHSGSHRTCTPIDTSKQSTNRIWFPIATRLANLLDFSCGFSAHKLAAIPSVACRTLQRWTVPWHAISFFILLERGGERERPHRCLFFPRK